MKLNVKAGLNSIRKIAPFLLVAGGMMLLFPSWLQSLLIGIYWGGAVITVALLTVLDWLCCARLLPAHVWVLWAIWGALIGMALGVWTLAPVYGLREPRHLIILAPFALMLAAAVVTSLVK